MKQIIHIEGMTCQGCASSVEKAIAQLPAVKSVSANPKTGVVAVLQQSPVHPDDIKAVLPPKTLWRYLSDSYKSIQPAMPIITAFSIKVASVIGRLSTEPKHAH